MIIEQKDLASIREKHAKNKIVYALGCFDLFHIGHLRLFEQSKKLGDILVVSVANDERVKQLKGATRPIIAAENRIEIVNGLRCVDYVLSHPAAQDDIAIDIIRELQPDVFANVSKERIEKMLALFPKMKGVHIPRTTSVTTSGIIESIVSKSGLS